MNTIFENEFLILKIDTEKDIFYAEWRSETENMDVPEYLENGARILQNYLKSKCRNGIINGIDFKFPISPDLQEKIAQGMIAQINGKVDKLAHIHPVDFIASLSTKQLWEENQNKTYSEHFFATVDDAIAWILKG